MSVNRPVLVNKHGGLRVWQGILAKAPTSGRSFLSPVGRGLIPASGQTELNSLSQSDYYYYINLINTGAHIFQHFKMCHNATRPIFAICSGFPAAL